MNTKTFPFVVFLLFSLILAACNSAGGFEPTAGQSAMTTEQAVVIALTDYLEGQGAPVDQMNVEVRAIGDDYARVEVISTDPAEPGGFNAFMKLENGVWTTVVSGSGMEMEHVEALGIPRSVWPESWLSQASQPDAGTAVPELSVADCPEAEPGAYQLIDAARGICLLYPDNFDVSEYGDGIGYTLFIRSLMGNHESPVIWLTFEPADGRSLEEVTDQRLTDYAFQYGFPDTESQAITLGSEAASMMDNLPGQDTNRRVVALHDDLVIDIMIDHIGENYGAAGEQAEAAYDMITSSFRFIGIDPEAPLIAGPECPEPVEDSTVDTNEPAGSCLPVPAESEESAILSVPATIYRDESYGFEFDYPATWTVSDLGVIGSRASASQFLEGEQTAMQLTLYLWDPQSDLSAYIDHRQSAWSASGATVVSQEEWNVDDAHPAASFVIQTQAGDEAFFFFTIAGDRYLELAGESDASLLSQIAHTMRLHEPNVGSQAAGVSTPICPELPRPAMVFQADNSQDYVFRHAASKSECTMQFDPPISRLLLVAADGLYYSTPGIGEGSTDLKIIHYANDGALTEQPFLDAESVRSLVISPDGTRVAWSQLRTARTAKDEEMVVYELYTATADGSDARLLHSVDNAAEVERGVPYIAWMIQPLRFMDDGDLLFTIGPDGRGGAWNAYTGRYNNLHLGSISRGEHELIYECPEDDYSSFCIADVSSDGAYFAVAYREPGEITLFRMDGTPVISYSGPGHDYTGFPTFSPEGDLVFMTADVADDQITIERAYLSLVAKPYEKTAPTTLLREPLSFIWGWVDAQHILYSPVNDGQADSFSPSLVNLDGSVERLPKTYGLFRGVQP